MKQPRIGNLKCPRNGLSWSREFCEAASGGLKTLKVGSSELQALLFPFAVML
jgi:hypothetical protein